MSDLVLCLLHLTTYRLPSLAVCAGSCSDTVVQKYYTTHLSGFRLPEVVDGALHLEQYVNENLNFEPNLRNGCVYTTECLFDR